MILIMIQKNIKIDFQIRRAYSAQGLLSLKLKKDISNRNSEIHISLKYFGI